MTDETIIDLNAARLDRGLPMVPVSYVDHVDFLDTATHRLAHLAINGADDDESYVAAEADCAAAIEAVEQLSREEPFDAEQTRALHERLVALPPLVEKLMGWCEVGDRIGDVCLIEAGEVRDEVLRLAGRLMSFGVAQAGRKPEVRKFKRSRAEVIDLTDERFDRGLPSIPVTFEEHVDYLAAAVHELVFSAIAASPTEGDHVLAGADAGDAYDAVDELPRELPIDPGRRHDLQERLGALPALIERVMVWCELGFRNGSRRRREVEAARDEALRLIGRLESFGVADDADDEPEVEEQWGGPLLALWSANDHD